MAESGWKSVQCGWSRQLKKWRSRESYLVAGSHRVLRARPTNTDLIPTHGEPESVKEDPARQRSKKASAGSGDLASGNKSQGHPSLLDTFHWPPFSHNVLTVW